MSNEPPPSSDIIYFDWNSLAESCIPFVAPFKIKVQVKHYMVSHCIVVEGASINILPVHA